MMMKMTSIAIILSILVTLEVANGKGLKQVTMDLSNPCASGIEFFRDPKDCQQYYQCSGKIAFGPISCGSKLAFNLETNMCDHLENVDCTGTETRAPTPAPPPTPSPAPTLAPTRAPTKPLPPLVGDICQRLETIFEHRGINPDADILYNSKRIKWHDVCTVIRAWNKAYPKKQFLEEKDENNNLLTFAAFFGNAAHESADYVACEEYIAPCLDYAKCSGGRADEYRDEDWGECYVVPVVTDGDFELTGRLPVNACSSSPKCISESNFEHHSGPDCWYGRGILQLTWNCNYAKAQRLIDPLDLNIDICARPDSICKTPHTYFATSLAYWMMSVDAYFKLDHRIETSMVCIKYGCHGTYDGLWGGPGNVGRRNEFNRIVEMLGATPVDPLVYM